MCRCICTGTALVLLHFTFQRWIVFGLSSCQYAGNIFLLELHIYFDAKVQCQLTVKSMDIRGPNQFCFSLGIFFHRFFSFLLNEIDKFDITYTYYIYLHCFIHMPIIGMNLNDACSTCKFLLRGPRLIKPDQYVTLSKWLIIFSSLLSLKKST